MSSVFLPWALASLVGTDMNRHVLPAASFAETLTPDFMTRSLTAKPKDSQVLPNLRPNRPRPPSVGEFSSSSQFQAQRRCPAWKLQEFGRFFMEASIFCMCGFTLQSRGGPCGCIPSFSPLLFTELAACVCGLVYFGAVSCLGPLHTGFPLSDISPRDQVAKQNCATAGAPSVFWQRSSTTFLRLCKRS